MVNEKLGENIRIFRTIKGYSQEGLANKLGKSQNWLQKIEKGEIDIPLSCLTELSEELGIRLLYVYNLLETSNNLTGKHSSTVRMTNQTLRIYSVVWSFTLSSNGSISGSINVSCNDKFRL